MAIPFANVNVEDYDVGYIKSSKTGNRFQDITPQLNLILREVRLFSEIQKRGIHKVIKFSCAISNEQADKLKELEKHTYQRGVEDGWNDKRAVCKEVS